MDNSIMHNKTIAEIITGLNAGEFSSVELTQHYLERIQRLDSTYNSFISVTDEAALARAKAADQQRAAGNISAFCGCANCPQRYFLHKRCSHQLRFENARQLYPAL